METQTPTDTPPNANPTTAFDAAFPADDVDDPSFTPTPEPDKPTTTDPNTGDPNTDTPTDDVPPGDNKGTPKDKPAQNANPEGDKSKGTPKPDDGDNTFEPPRVAKPNDLRGWALRMGARAKKAEEELKAAQEFLKKQTSAPQADPALAQELAETKKRLESYEQEIRLTKYERSAEYQEKYRAPFENLLKRAHKLSTQLIVTEQDPENPDIKTERPATANDFNNIFHLKAGEAAKVARQMFGESAPIVMDYYSRLHDLQESAWEAIEAHKAQAVEHENKTTAQQKQEQAARSAMFEQATKAHASRNAMLYQPRADDKEGNELLEKGTAFARAVFAGPGNLSPQQVAMRDAQAHNWLAVHPRLVRDLKKSRAEVAALQKTIAELRSAGPGKPTVGGSQGDASGSGDILADFDKAVV